MSNIISTDDLQRRYDKLLDLTMRMRGYQKEYDRYHMSESRKRKQELERQTDRFLADELAKKKSKQSEMF